LTRPGSASRRHGDPISAPGRLVRRAGSASVTVPLVCCADRARDHRADGRQECRVGHCINGTVPANTMVPPVSW